MARFHAAAVPLALTLWTACSPGFAGETAAAPSAQKEELVIGVREFLSDIPAMIADQDGLYAREGVKVRTIVNPTGRNNALLFGERSIDLAIVGNHIGVEALSRAPKDDPLVVLACLGGGGERWRLMASTGSAATSVEGLQGRKLGAWPHSYGYHLLERFLKERGITTELVRVPMDPEQAAAALENGKVDALFAWEPIPAMLEERHAAREIFTLKGMGEGIPVYLVARRSVVRENSARIAGVLRALDRATAFVNGNPEQAALRVSARLRVPVPVLTKALKKGEYRLGLTCRQRESLREVIRVFRERDLNRIPAGTEIEFDPEPLRAALRAVGAGEPAAVEDGCPERSDAPATAAGGAAAPARPRSLGNLSVGFFLGGRTSILMRIRESGGFGAEGLDVSLLSKSLRGKEFSPVTRETLEKRDYPSKATGTDLLDGLLKGSWDLATIGESSFLAAVAEKKPILAVARLGSDLGDKSGHLFAVRKGLRLDAPADYRGKVLVSRRAGPGDEAFLLEYLSRAGIDLDRDVLVLAKLPASLKEKRALPQDKVLLVKQVYEDDLKAGVRDGRIDGGFFHLMAFEKMKDALDMVKPLQGWVPADQSMALLVCRRDFVANPEGRAKTSAFLRAFVKGVRLEKAMSPEMRAAQGSSDEAVQRWRGLESSLPDADYPQYSEDPKVDLEPLASMAALLRKHKLVDWPELDLAAHIDNSLVEDAVRSAKEGVRR